MTCLNKRWALISLGLFIMALGANGVITIVPSNTAVLNGTSTVVMSCASDGIQVITWAYFPVGGSALVDIASGSTVYDTQSYAVNQSGSQQSNLTILSATMARAGTYYCSQGLSQQTSAQLIVVNSDPVCRMTPTAPTELLYNQVVQMNCSISYTANTSYVAVNMIWSKGNPFTVVNSTEPQTNTTANLTTAVSTITVTPGNFTPFPIYSCNTSFSITGNPPTKASGYSKSTPLFNSPINVIYLKPADENSITGARSGDSVYQGTTVTCNVDASPAAIYSWLDVTYGNTTNSSSIQIWHSGEYQCTAWNRAASTSASVNVTTYITTAAPTTTTTPTTTVTSLSTSRSSPSGTDGTAPETTSQSGGLSDTNKIIIGVVVGVGGALLIVAVAVLVYCCLKKKNKPAKYTNEGSLNKPPPYDDGHQGPQRSANPDIVQGYQLDDYPQQQLSPYKNHQNRPYIEDEGLNYAQIQLDNNPRSRQPLQVTEETNYSDVRLA